MRLRPLPLICATALLAACGTSEPTAPVAKTAPERAATVASAPATLVYPTARKVEQIDDYHGTAVTDSYRWMEDLDSPELKTWIDGANAVTQQYLADAPGRAKIKERLGQLWNYERYGYSNYGVIPVKRGTRYFYSRNDGLKNQFEIFVQDGLDGEPRLLLDPNTLSADGTISLAEIGISEDGKRFAYSLSDGGSDWRSIKVRDVDSGTDLADDIQWAKFTGIDWAKDGSGFYYSRFDAPTGENQLKAVNKFQKVYFHTIGTTQDKDTLVYERQDQPDWGFGARVSDDGKYLVISVSQGTDERNLLFYKDLSRADSKVVELIADWTATYEFIGNDGPVFFLRTDDGAERGRVIALDTRKPAKANWAERIAQSDSTLTDVSLIHHQFIASYLKDAHSVVQVYALDGKPVREVALPGLGTVDGLEGGADSDETFFSFVGYTTPATLYRYNAVDGSVHVFRQPKVAFDPSQYETTQVFYTSKDGTKIPMFITGRKGLARDGNTPTILYGYGGFNISVTPAFSANTIAWLEMGGLYASANLRGGGEYGRAWHEAGMKLVKQNVFDDFAAAAEYLIAEKYTRPAKLAISGRSNGGLLVGATALQRPELFGAALPAVGVMDMLRFREFTIGWAWEADYGSVKNKDEFAAIHAYSPLHNIKTGVEYPPTLITTADHDDRVFPAHSFKYAAALQDAYKGDRPMLIRVETRAGHGAGKPTTKIIEEQADIYAFLTKTLQMDVK
jgi:prolyl oligopeptidase